MDSVPRLERYVARMGVHGVAYGVHLSHIQRNIGRNDMTKLELPVKVGIGTLPRPMTREQARRYGERNMPADLRRAGFQTVVFRSDAEIHGGDWFRINYGYSARGAA